MERHQRTFFFVVTHACGAAACFIAIDNSRISPLFTASSKKILLFSFLLRAVVSLWPLHVGYEHQVAVRWPHLVAGGKVTSEASPPLYDITKGKGFRTVALASLSENWGEQKKDRIPFFPVH